MVIYYTVSRPINGISLNGDEYLLNEQSTAAMEFSTSDSAVEFLCDKLNVSREEVMTMIDNCEISINEERSQ